MNEMNNTERKKRIAIVAHNSKSSELIEWSYFNKAELSKHELIATVTASKILEGTVNIPVPLNWQLDWDQQLALLIEANKIDILIFFWDKEDTVSQRNKMKKLLNTAISSNTVIASNIATANVVMASLSQQTDKLLNRNILV